MTGSTSRRNLLSLAAVLSAFALLTPAPAARADQLDDIRAAGVLKCGVGGNYKPFSFVQDPKSRKLVGYDIDICEAVARSIGVKPELVFIASATRITDLQQGRTELGMAAITHTPERAKLIDFSYNYMETSVKVAVPANSIYQTFADLAGKRFAGTQGSNLEIKLPKVIEQPQLQAFASPASAFLALEQGKVDAMAADETTLLGLIGPGKDKFRLLEQPVSRDQIGLGVRKGETRLLGEVNKALMELERSGRAADIFEQWFGDKSELKMKRGFRFAPYRGN